MVFYLDRLDCDGDRDEWKDVTPLQQDDGSGSDSPDSVVSNDYSIKFGRKLSDDSVREWAQLASREIAVFRDIMKKEKQDKIQPVFPNVKSSRALVQPGKEPEVSHPASYCSSQSRSKRNQKAKECPELLPDIWFANGFHKRVPMVSLRKLSDEEISSITTELADTTLKSEASVNQFEKEDYDENDAELAVANPELLWLADAFLESEDSIDEVEKVVHDGGHEADLPVENPEILCNDYFDDLNIQESSFISVVDGIETEFSSADLQDFLHTLLETKLECGVQNVPENIPSSI